MELARALIWAVLLAALAACSEVTGVALRVVGELPPDFSTTMRGAALATGFMDASTSHPSDARESDAYFFERASEHGALPVLIQGRHSADGYGLTIGRSIYGAYSAEERTAVIAFISGLRARGIKLTKEWANDFELPVDLERWLEGNRAHGA